MIAFKIKFLICNSINRLINSNEIQNINTSLGVLDSKCINLLFYQYFESLYYKTKTISFIYNTILDKYKIIDINNSEEIEMQSLKYLENLDRNPDKINNKVISSAQFLSLYKQPHKTRQALTRQALTRQALTRQEIVTYKYKKYKNKYLNLLKN